jgi:hypothetical protein
MLENDERSRNNLQVNAEGPLQECNSPSQDRHSPSYLNSECYGNDYPGYQPQTQYDYYSFNVNVVIPFDRRFMANKICTSKYTWYNFLPKNFFIQFTKLANIYFLLILILQVIKEMSISNGKPAILFPLSFVIIMSAIKDIIEDSKRHKSDDIENNRKCLVANIKT